MNRMLNFVRRLVAPVGALWATLSTEANVLTKQRLEIMLAGASPFAQTQFRNFLSFLVTQKGEKRVQIISIADLTADVNPLDGAIVVFGIYLKKQATGTDAFYNIFDDATDDSTAGDAKLSVGLLTSGEEFIGFYPSGLALAAGLVHGSYTALIGSNGSTPSTTGDGPNGFVVVGA